MKIYKLLIILLTSIAFKVNSQVTSDQNNINTGTNEIMIGMPDGKALATVMVIAHQKVLFGVDNHLSVNLTVHETDNKN